MPEKGDHFHDKGTHVIRIWLLDVSLFEVLVSAASSKNPLLDYASNAK